MASSVKEEVAEAQKAGVPSETQQVEPATDAQSEPERSKSTPADPAAASRAHITEEDTREEESDEGEVSSDDQSESKPAAAQSTEDAPPLPNEPVPEPADDGWSCEWDAARGAWYFFNRFTNVSQWDNPRLPTGSASQTPAAPGTQDALSNPVSVAGGYNPAIHGDWDPNAAYAQAYTQGPGEGEEGGEALPDASILQVPGAFFNKRTGKFQQAEEGAERHNDEAKSHRQMDAYFDVDKAANSHDGRSLKAERQGKKPTKKELTQWKEKRKAKKEERRRAWLRD